MKTTCKALSAESAETLLEQLHARDVRIEALLKQLEGRDRRIKSMDETLKAARLVAGHPPAQPTQIQVFWLAPEGFSEEHSRRLDVAADGMLREHLIELPTHPAGLLRIDPGATPGFWEIESVGLHGVNSDQTISAQAVVECDRGNGFFGLAVGGGALQLPAGPEVFSVFAISTDPQLLWNLPLTSNHQPTVLKIRCRSRSCAEGYLQSMLMCMGHILEVNGRHPSRENVKLQSPQTQPEEMERMAKAAVYPTSPWFRLRRWLGNHFSGDASID